ncbi:MAG: B12-binding domain-containing radical SAM protein [Syntrophothermus sp.]
MKVRFIAPADVVHEPGGKRRRSLFPPLNLGMLAALTPPDWEVEVVDESVQPVDLDAPVDLVAITAITSVAPKAYQLADAFRARGARVVLGGIHASALPWEAAKHADAVVVGEAELSWPKVLADFKEGRLAKLYECPDRPPLEGLPVPRRDLFDRRSYLTVNLIQTTRGCPHSCSFCSVTRFFGRSYRTRPIPEILKEVESLEGETVLFVDDNIVGKPAYAKELFRALTPYRLKWIGQSSLTIARDEELLRLAARSGCIGLFIGFESLAPHNLQEIGKNHVNNAERFKEFIEKIHSYGIGIEGAFIFGFDQDDRSVFERTVEFARKVKLAAAQFGILTPFPGTPLYEKLERAGRIIERDWSKYTISHVVFEPLQMTREALQNGFNWAYHEFYSYRSILERLFLGFKKNLGFFFPLNMSFRQIVARLPRGSV